MQKMGWFGVVRGHSRSWAMPPFDRAHTTSYSKLGGDVTQSYSLCANMMSFIKPEVHVHNITTPPEEDQRHSHR